MLFSFFVLGLLAYRTYEAGAPGARQSRRPPGKVLFTGDDISEGQQVFLHNGLMEYGSVFGHGAYLGPDYTADYLRRASNLSIAQHGRHPDGPGRDRDRRFPGTGRGRRRTEDDRGFPDQRLRRAVRSPDLEPDRVRRLREAHPPLLEVLFRTRPTENGLRPNAITDPEDLREPDGLLQLDRLGGGGRAARTRLLVYEQLAPRGPRRQSPDARRSRLERPLHHCPARRDRPALRVLSAATTFLGWQRRERIGRRFRAPSNFTDAGTEATAWFFAVVAALFLVQTLLGGATAHYHAELADSLDSISPGAPIQPARTWHLQLGLFWVVASFLAAGIFLAPMIAGSEPRGQRSHLLPPRRPGGGRARHPRRRGRQHTRDCSRARASTVFGRQGWEYLDLGRLWQLLLIVGLVVWCVILFRGLRQDAASRALRQSPLALLLQRSFDPPSTRSACWPAPRTTSPSPISGASGWCISGSKISWSCSPRSWSPTSSCCWESCPQGQRCASSTSISCCTPPAAWSARCTTCISAARPPSTWRSERSSRPRRSFR